MTDPCPLPDCVATREALARELAYRTLGGTPPPCDTTKKEPSLRVLPDDQESETWLPVTSFPGYEVSSAGRVRSVKRTVVSRRGVVQSLAGKVLRPHPNSTGYLRVSLPEGQRAFVHSLVLEYFVGPRPDGAVIRHLDGDQLNNRVWNLAYGTASENSLDTVRHGRNHYAVRTHCPRDHPLVAPNLVVGVLKKGRRDCLACHRGREKLRWHGEGCPSFDRLKAVSDAYFRAITLAPQHRDAS